MTTTAPIENRADHRFTLVLGQIQRKQDEDRIEKIAQQRLEDAFESCSTYTIEED